MFGWWNIYSRIHSSAGFLSKGEVGTGGDLIADPEFEVCEGH